MKSLKKENQNLREQKGQPKKDASIVNNVNILDSDEMSHFRVVREISFGGSGKVLEVDKEEKYALKEMNVSGAGVKELRNFVSEYDKLCMLHHPNIIHALGVFLSDSKRQPSILLELCKSDIGNLIKNSKLSNVDISKFVYQIVEGMKYVHKCQMIHRDLKPSNILIGMDGLIRISDFGISKFIVN